MYDIVLKNTNKYLFTIHKKCFRIINFYLRFSKLFKFFGIMFLNFIFIFQNLEHFAAKFVEKIVIIRNKK